MAREKREVQPLRTKTDTEGPKRDCMKMLKHTELYNAGVKGRGVRLKETSPFVKKGSAIMEYRGKPTTP